VTERLTDEDLTNMESARKSCDTYSPRRADFLALIAEIRTHRYRQANIVDGVHAIPHDAIDAFISRAEQVIDEHEDGVACDSDFCARTASYLTDAVDNLRQLRGELRAAQLTDEECEALRWLRDDGNVTLANREGAAEGEYGSDGNELPDTWVPTKYGKLAVAVLDRLLATQRKESAK